MGDDHSREEKPSTSKNGTNKGRNDARDKRRKGDDDNDGRNRGDEMETVSSDSILSSVRSRLAMARPGILKSPLGKRGKPEKKGRVTRGRVSKRRSATRYQMRKTPQNGNSNSIEKRQRDPSESTVLSRMSSRSGSDSVGCCHCGHHSCGKRSDIEIEITKMDRGQRKRLVKNITEQLRGMRQGNSSNKTKGSEGHQVGSASKMLSPLFIRSNHVIEEEALEERSRYNEITPEMIFLTLRKLQEWNEFSNLEAILSDIKLCYPVNPNEEKLTLELVEKLKVAVIAGIVIKAENKDIWCLAKDVQLKGLTENHVILFWKTCSNKTTTIAKNRQNETSVFMDKMDYI